MLLKCHITKFSLFFLSFILLSVHIAYAQSIETEKKRAYLLYSPFHTMFYHAHNLQTDNYHPELAALCLSPNYPAFNTQNRIELSIKLKQILDGNGLYFDEAVIPKEMNYMDSTSKEHIYIPFKKFPTVYLEKIGNQWFYSASTLEAIPALYKQTFPFESDKLYEFLVGKTAQDKLWGLTIFHYLALCVLLILPFILFKMLNIVMGWILRLVIGKLTEEENRRKRIRRLARPITLFFIFWMIVRLIPIFQFPAQLSYYLLLVVNIFLPVFALMMTIGLVNVVILLLEKRVSKERNIWFFQLLPFIQTSLHIVAGIITLIYALELLDLNVTALLAGLSIGGLAVALAAQDTFKNFFGSITIFIDSPFKVGDWIVAEGIDGEVEEIGIRSTRIRTFYNSVLHIPNGRMADMTIDNMGLRVYRRYRTHINITYHTPPILIKAFVKGLREIASNHAEIHRQNTSIYFHELGEHSLNILFNIFIYAKDFDEEWEVREDINLQILALAKHFDIHFAFPTQTLHIEEIPSQPSPTQMDEDLTDEELDKKLNAFFKTH
jgi:MscS family membrane protein